MSRIAFLTMDSLDGFISYDALVADCLAARGIAVENVSWRSSTANWDDYDVVIIRSPWDYQHSVNEFIAVLEDIDASDAVLWNPIDVVRWNVRKTYLQELHDHGITIVPTRFVESPVASQIREMFDVFESDEIVIKPVVGANANDTFWLRPDSLTDLLQQIEALYQGRLALLQPFIQSVVEYGETSHIFFDGQHSHSVLKTPKAGDFRVQEEHGSRIQLLQPDAAIIECAKRALQAVPQHTLYGRVDLVELSNGQQAVMELELIEPSLYLTYDADSAERFADAIQRFRA
jgi:glutathione synthase/RimK-type ligase-like ATP-grasp enzyme